MTLANKTCKPCHGGVEPLTPSEYKPLLEEVPNWQVIDGKQLQRVVKTRDFAQSLSLANQIGEIADEQGHHPDLLVSWGKLQIDIWTHAINGLSESDFILAAKINQAIR